MLGKLFGMGSDDKDAAQARAKATERLKLIEGSASAELAAGLLCAPTALMQLSPEDAKTVVSYMRPMRIQRGMTFIDQGDEKTDFMILVLEGEVTVETIVVSRVSPITVTVLGPGSLIGEMGLVDGEPRSASCTASTDVRCTILSRDDLEQLIEDNPRTGAKLMMAVALRIAARLRDSADKLKLYTQLVQAMQQEIDRVMPTPDGYRSNPPEMS
jgi:CRP-like cAMP-binding protein